MFECIESKAVKIGILGYLCLLFATSCCVNQKATSTSFPVGTDPAVTILPSTNPAEPQWPSAVIERTPEINQPTQNETVIVNLQSNSSSEYPVQGSVSLEDGRCCIGGIAGDTISIQASFSASSPLGDIREMRVKASGSCLPEEEMVKVAWEPYLSSKSFPFTLPINWVGFWVSVQYKDSLGNLSPVYCDDISAEGMPAPPSGSP